MSDAAISVLLMDDHVVVREGLRALSKETASTELGEAVRKVARGQDYLQPGHTNAEIASMLYVSVRTVENHRASVMRKLGLRTRADLARHANEAGLV